MKKIIVVTMLLLATNLLADTYVNGYTKSNGTYVNGYMKTNPNSTRNDNYSTQGNYNPYTGQEGTKPRDDGYGTSYGNGTSKKSKYDY